MDLDENQPVEIFYPRAKDRDKDKEKNVENHMTDILEGIVTHEELLEIAQKTLEQFLKGRKKECMRN